ncbi:hypothetical protein GALMADRAFT_1126308 [Galerina marginata CBS 339.88]|uniref:Transmembrane protein n=1 Tax=Galerina marginata (strain CBS 339.88) TaxID=685588 RepID=A0A067SHM1_GALM3|nr:hypothetical protein GALMADRAFT_1126308 [Galerina marginata CBS 339.88]
MMPPMIKEGDHVRFVPPLCRRLEYLSLFSFSSSFLFGYSVQTSMTIPESLRRYSVQTHSPSHFVLPGTLHLKLWLLGCFRSAEPQCGSAPSRGSSTTHHHCIFRATAFPVFFFLSMLSFFLIKDGLIDAKYS